MTRTQEAFIKNFRRLREYKNLSRADIAKRAELSTNYICGLENGRRFPSPETIDKICACLEVKPFELFYDPLVDYEPVLLSYVEERVKKSVREHLVEILRGLFA